MEVKLIKDLPLYLIEGEGLTTPDLGVEERHTETAVGFFAHCYNSDSDAEVMDK